MELFGPGKGISNDKPLRKSTSLTDITEFFLETQSRVRPSNVQSSEEREEEFMKQIPKFKARPLNKKVRAWILSPCRQSTLWQIY